MRSTPKLPRLAVLPALIALASALGCAPPEPPVELRVTGEATLTQGSERDTVQGTAQVTLFRAPGEGGVADVTIVSVSADIEGFDTTFTIDDPSPIHLLPGESVDVGFHFEGTPSSVVPSGPWGRVCDALPGSPELEEFGLNATFFDSVRDVSGGSVIGSPVTGTGTLHREDPLFALPPPGVASAIWSKRFGGAGDDAAYGVAVDASGNLLISGSSLAGIDFGQGPLSASMFLAKMGPGGEVMYGRSIGSGTYPPFVASGGGVEVVAGTFMGETQVGDESLVAPPGRTGVYVARVDAMGNVLWVESFLGPPSLFVSAVTVDPMGGIALGGLVAGVDAIDLGGGPLAGTTEFGVYLLGLDASGAHVHSHRFDHMQQLHGMVVDPSGALLLTGTLFESVDLGGGPLPVTASGESWSAKFDATGAHVWSQLHPWTWSLSFPRIATNAAGDALLVVGRDVAKLDPSGALLWTRPIDGLHEATSAAMDDAGRIFLANTFTRAMDLEGNSLLAGSNNVHALIELDSSGSVTRATAFGCDDGRATALHHRPGVPGVALAGSFRSIAALDQGPLTSAGGADVLAAMILP